nr:calmodulin-binding transcription activator 3-like isoform X1 [Ipomoea batatas]
MLEAQHRWLRPAEICEILSNYQKFRIAPEPPTRPPSGSLFLFDRKVLRYFRKDGHNWRKKKDGKTVKEAHEKLKSGSIDVLHCYYAHGEENENFQRRSYWLLEESQSNIVLVHYREVKVLLCFPLFHFDCENDFFDCSFFFPMFILCSVQGKRGGV